MAWLRDSRIKEMGSALLATFAVVLFVRAAELPPAEPNIVGPPALVQRLLGIAPPHDGNGLAGDTVLQVRAELRAGSLMHAIGRLNEGADADRRAVVLSTALIRAQPNSSPRRLEAAAAHNNLGAVLRGQSQWKASENEYRIAAELLESLIQLEPFQPAHRRLLAVVRTNL